MQFPKTNKIHRDLETVVGENAKLLQELLDSIQWRRFLNYYCAFFGVFLASLALTIIVVRLCLLVP